MVGIVAAALLLLGVLPTFFLIRDAARDPVFAGLDRLDVPSWANVQHQDDAAGSPWCIGTCRLRERILRSSRPAQTTDAVYEKALVDAGWQRWEAGRCPSGMGGVYTCWERDQYALDLWTRELPCDLSNLGGTPSAKPVSPTPSAAVPGLPDPGASASGPPATCGGALVTVKVANKIDPAWHH
jgi:hypothetical protein